MKQKYCCHNSIIYFLRETLLIVATTAWRHLHNFSPSKPNTPTKSPFSVATMKADKSLKSTDFTVSKEIVKRSMDCVELDGPWMSAVLYNPEWNKRLHIPSFNTVGWISKLWLGAMHCPWQHTIFFIRIVAMTTINFSLAGVLVTSWGHLSIRGWFY